VTSVHTFFHHFVHSPLQDVREKKETHKSRARFWEVAGSKMGQITGGYLVAAGRLPACMSALRAAHLAGLHVPQTHIGCSKAAWIFFPTAAGLTEAEEGEAAKAAEALREQQGGSDDDADDYRKASKVRQPAY